MTFQDAEATQHKEEGQAVLHKLEPSYLLLRATCSVARDACAGGKSNTAERDSEFKT